MEQAIHIASSHNEQACTNYITPLEMRRGVTNWSKIKLSSYAMQTHNVA